MKVFKGCMFLFLNIQRKIIFYAKRESSLFIYIIYLIFYFEYKILRKGKILINSFEKSMSFTVYKNKDIIIS